MGPEMDMVSDEWTGNSRVIEMKEKGNGGKKWKPKGVAMKWKCI